MISLPTSDPPSSYNSPASPLPAKLSIIQVQPLLMAPVQEQYWERFSDDGGGSGDDIDEALSLCDLPMKSPDSQEPYRCKSSEALEDFEFRTCGSGSLLRAPSEADMCPADDIFYRGRLLPLRASLSLRTCDRSNSNNGSNYSSSSCSSTSVSRSQSSGSHSSSFDVPRLSIANKFYAHPSPRPQVRTNIYSGRKSTGSAPPGWALFRLGVAKAPEIELNSLRSRRLRSTDTKCVSKAKRSASKFGFSCKSSPDVSEPLPVNSTRPLMPKKDGLERKESISKRSRMFEWLEQLSIV